MKGLRRFSILCILFVGTLLAGMAAKADSITITLTDAFLTVPSGGTALFDATVTNTTPDWVYLNGAEVSIDAPLTPNDVDFVDYFYVNFPLYLTESRDPNDTFGPADIFAVNIPAGTPNGVYGGEFDILGGPTPDDLNVVGTVDFDVQVAGTTTPEPNSFLLMGTGLLLLGAVAGRKLLA
jgi:hypothetical protein